MAALPTIPKSLLGERAALSVTEITQKLRTVPRVDPADAADVADRHQQYLDSLAGDQASLIAFSQDLRTAVSVLGTVFTQEQTLAAPTTAIVALVAPVAKSVLKVVIIVDGTAGRQITWSSDFVGASVDFDNSINTTSYFTFLGRTLAGATKWHLSELPLTGQA